MEGNWEWTVSSQTRDLEEGAGWSEGGGLTKTKHE